MIKNLQAILSCATAVASLSTVTVMGAVVSTAGCSDDEEAGCPAACPAGCPAPAGDAQTPPQGSDAVISAWISAASYKGAGWKCEPAVHAARSPSPHGMNKICNNTKLTMTAAAPYGFGIASVKELYDANGTTLAGIAIGLKLYDGASDGSKWYWYEKMAGSVVYNGPGKKDNTDVCSGCHAGAGSDAGHSGKDFVYTQVP